MLDQLLHSRMADASVRGLNEKHSTLITLEAGSRVAYEGHVPLNTFENAFLAAGSALASLYDPRRHGKLVNCSALQLSEGLQT